MDPAQYINSAVDDDGPAGVEVLHWAPGRCRLRVAGLKRDAALARYLMTRLRLCPGVERVVPSPWTGSMLVRGPATTEPDGLCWIVAATLHKYVKHAKGPAAGAVLPLCEDVAWHATEVDSVLARLGVSPQLGLSDEGAEQRLRADGSNDLPEPLPPMPLALFAKQLASVPMAVLGASAFLSLLSGGLLDASLIGFVISTNALIGYRNERKTAAILAEMAPRSSLQTFVVRSGRRRTVPSHALTVGDLVLLTPGPVPADLRVIEARDLTVDESTLTGESEPVLKSARPVADATPLPDRQSMLFRGTAVIGGAGVGVIVATGGETEIGRLARLTQAERRPATPLELQLDQLGRSSAALALGVSAGMLALGLGRGMRGAEILKTAVSLAIAAIPEGLSAVGTLALAQGARRLRRRQVHLRDLSAVEALGRIEYLCLDKTGTITMNRMTAVGVATPALDLSLEDGEWIATRGAHGPINGAASKSEDLSALIEVAVLCNDALDGKNGSPTERALLGLAAELGTGAEALRAGWRRSEALDRGERRPWMTTWSRREDRHAMHVKGSPLEVLELCTSVLRRGKKVPMTAATRRRILEANERFAKRALRVLGFASATTDGRVEQPRDLVWHGLIGLADPPRHGVAQVIDELAHAGIKTILVTGDQVETARAVARELGLSGKDRCLPVHARVSPREKLELVRHLQKDGAVVAMTGDGVNDGPALRAADVGIALGASGTDAARDAAGVILGEDDFLRLPAAVRQGRALRSNLKRAVRFLVTTNLSEILVTVSGLIRSGKPAFSPSQLLWINVMTDVLPALALSLEPEDESLMHEPPPRNEHRFFSRRETLDVACEALALTAGTILLSGPDEGDEPHATRRLLALVAGQGLYALALPALEGSGRIASFRLRRTVLGTIFLQLLATRLPGLSQVLALTPATPRDLGYASLAGLLPVLALSLRGSATSVISIPGSAERTR